METFNLETLKPRFKLGESNQNFCDCVGLVILYLKSKDYACTWEKFVKREITNWEDFNRQMASNGFSKVKSDFYVEETCIVWREEDGTGHIGIVHNNFIYQMTPYGIQISSEIPATKRPVYWYY
jgi:hypothetical protein